jgi:hypothetical protein
MSQQDKLNSMRAPARTEDAVLFLLLPLLQLHSKQQIHYCCTAKQHIEQQEMQWAEQLQTPALS